MSWHKPPTARRPGAPPPGDKPKLPVARGYDSDPAIRAYYKTAEWARVRKLCLTFNPVCQLIVNGEQCHQPARIAHQLISPRVNPNKVYDWQNIVMVCDAHHPDTPGEPIDSNNVYAITNGILGATFDPNTLIARMRGTALPSDNGRDGKPGSYHTVESLLKRLKR